MAMANLKTISEYVWFYYKQGLSIIPLGVNSENNLKAPSSIEWKQFYSRKPTEKEIKSWLKKGLFKGIGIIGGEVSGNLAIIDFDDSNIPNEIGLDLGKIMAKGNWVAKTGKGWHIYCRGTEPVRTRKAAAVSMDLKASKGYVAAPPSPHELGVNYKFLNEKLGEIPKQEVMGMFDDIVAKIKKVRHIKPPRAKEIQAKGGEPPCITLMKQGAESGRRNETVYALANYYRYSKNTTLDDTINLLTSWNNKNNEPLDDSELIQTIRSAYNGDHPTGCSSIVDLGYCQYEDKNDCPCFKKNSGESQLLKQYKVFRFSKEGGIIGVSYPNLGRLIKVEHSYNFLVVRDESTDKKTIYAYENGYYNHNGKDIIKGLVHKYLGDLATIKAKDEVIAAISDTSSGVDRSAVEPPRNLVNFKNGIVDIKTGKLVKHTPEFKFLQLIPHDYIPNAKCPSFLKFLSEISQKDQIPIIQEMFGYAMYRGYPVSAIFLLFGTGRNGKSVLLKVLRAMLGQKNICSRKLHEITEDVFAKADLYGRLVNVCGEMEGQTMKQTGNLKELTGEDYVTAQRKYHGSFQFQNYAKLIFSTNVVPKSVDMTFGLMDRFRVLRFTKIFNSSNPKTDANLFDNTLNTEEELEGIIIWALKGLNRLLVNSSISGNVSLGDIGKEYDHAVNYIWEWLEDNLASSNDSTDYLTVEDIYKKFTRWCLKFDEPTTSITEFGSKLFGYANNNIGSRKKRKWINGRYVFVYERVKFRGD